MGRFSFRNLLILPMIFLITSGLFSGAIAAQIRLAWDANTEGDLAGYKVYYGTAPASYGSPVNAGNVTSYTLTGLTVGQRYYIALKAYDTSSNHSGYSNEVNGVATEPQETVSTPTKPTGPPSGTVNTSYSFSTGGSSSNLGHSVQYQFDWKGDETDLSAWGSATQSKTWSLTGTYNVRARARCASCTSVVSSWSSALTVSIGQAGTSYTVATNPPGRHITVDGTNFTAPRTFEWAAGSSHTISVPSPQNGTEGTRYVFSSWSDGGAESHTVVAPSSNTTYTADLTTQYSLTTSAEPSDGGTVNPSGTTWYNSGETASISAEKNPGYKFNRWTGDLRTKKNPASLMMSKPKNVKASFSEGNRGPKVISLGRGTLDPSKMGSGSNTSHLPLLAKLEAPTGGERVSGVKPIYGWAVDGEGVSVVELYVDGIYICDIPYGGIREDIGKAYPDYPESGRSGFAVIWNYSVLSPGEHTVLVRVYNARGETLDLQGPATVVKFHGDLVTGLAPDTNLSQEISVTADGVTRIYDVNLQWFPERQDFGIKEIISRD